MLSVGALDEALMVPENKTDTKQTWMTIYEVNDD